MSAPVLGRASHSSESGETIHPQRVARLRPEQLSTKSVAGEIARIIEKAGLRLAVCFDELDHVLAWDERQGFALMHMLRELSYSENCSFYFAGSKHTQRAVEDTRNPLYNFTSPEWILPFERTETTEMVETPMENLDVDITSTDLANIIHRESGGQPELIQHICGLVLNHLEATGKLIQPSELSALLATDRKFESSIYRTFLHNTSPYQQLATLILIKAFRDRGADGAEEVVAADLLRLIEKGFRKFGVDVDHYALREMIADLEMAGVIAKTKGRMPICYRFAVPRLADYFVVYDFESEINRLCRGL